MRLTPRNKKRRRTRGPRIAISQDEITADLNYRGGEPRRAGQPAPAQAGREPPMSAHRGGAPLARRCEWSDPVATAAAGAELAGIDYMRALAPASSRRRRSR